MNEEVYASGAPLQQPALEVTNSERSAPTLLVHDTTNSLIKSTMRPTRKEGVASLGTGLPNKGVHWNSDVGGIVLDKLEDELTSIVKTPQPPPLRPVPPTVYRAGFQQEGEGQEEELGGGARRGQRSPGRGTEGDDLPELDENYK